MNVSTFMPTYNEVVVHLKKLGVVCKPRPAATYRYHRRMVGRNAYRTVDKSVDNDGK